MDLNIADIKNLANLLRTEPSDSESDDDLPKRGTRKMAPGHIGKPNSKCTVRRGNVEENEEDDEEDEDAIWTRREIEDSVECDISTDPRKRPEVDIKYMQRVTAEDLFLQMSAKTPATSSCEDMVLTIKMPGEKGQSVDLDVTPKQLDIRSPLYRLALALPDPVDPKSSKAEWDDDTETLSVTLRLDREYDFINF